SVPVLRPHRQLQSRGKMHKGCRICRQARSLIVCRSLCRVVARPLHLGKMSVGSCDSMSALRTSEEPLAKYVPACLLPLLAGCCAAGVPSEVSCRSAYLGRPAVLAASESAGEGVVFVANGSGDYRSVSANLSQVVTETATPLQMQTVPWSHGPGRFLA